jgi:hypothetical protein
VYWTDLVREKYSSKSCEAIPVEFTSLSPHVKQYSKKYLFPTKTADIA